MALVKIDKTTPYALRVKNWKWRYTYEISTVILLAMKKMQCLQCYGCVSHHWFTCTLLLMKYLYYSPSRQIASYGRLQSQVSPYHSSRIYHPHIIYRISLYWKGLNVLTGVLKYQ